MYLQGLGIAQTGNYREGFQKFAEKVYTDNPKHQSQLPTTITGRPLVLNEATHIPDAINYKKFDTEYAKAGVDAIQKIDTKQRLWVYNKYKNKDGIIVYFLLPHPYTAKDFPVKLEDQLRRLDPLLHRLTSKRTPMPNVLTKREGQPSEAKPVQPLHRSTNHFIQAKGEDWGKLAEAWQIDRKNWVAGKGSGSDKPKAFLKEQAKGVKKKAEIDEKLNVTPSSPLIREQIKNVRKIRFWSSLRGRILGALRFRFGSVFDKVEDLFQKIKDKFKRHHEASELLNKKEGLWDGWKKKATKLIIKFSVEIFKQTIIEAFKGFINCANGIIEAILNKFKNVVDESKAEAVQQIEPVCCDVMAFKNKVEEEYQKHDATITNFTQKIETLRQWTDILDDVVTAVRVGVQIVSCGLPPGLGCLWGLVAQLGISASLNLLTRTDYFEEEIAKPAARKLMDTIVGDSLHNLLIDLLEAFPPLKPFVQEASACRKRTSVISGSRTIGGNTGKLDPNDPKNIKAREEWEKEYESEILKDLQAVFEKGKGKKVTKEDLQKLVEAIQKSGKSAEEMKQMLEQARNPASRKIDVGKAEINLEMDEVLEAKPKERTIDYEKAVRTNVAFQKLNGWDPEQILKMPGIKVDSNEFADAVYDLQEALGIKKDGMLGEETIIAFYDNNKMKKDAIYEKAVKVKDQKTQEKEKAKADTAKQASSTSTESKDIIAVRVSKPPIGAPVEREMPSQPGWISTPFGVVTPALSESKTAYSVGENISVDIAFWIDKEWVWFTNIQGKFQNTGSINEQLLLGFSVSEDYYFKLTGNADITYLYAIGNHSIVYEIIDVMITK